MADLVVRRKETKNIREGQIEMLNLKGKLVKVPFKLKKITALKLDDLYKKDDKMSIFNLFVNEILSVDKAEIDEDELYSAFENWAEDLEVAEKK